jgi:enterochelin esterase-like enzyme
MEYAVYQPLDRKPEERLPLVIFLHGAGDDPHCFDEAGVGQRLDAAIEQGRTPRVLIAIPQGDMGFWENWADGSRNYRDWVLDELLPEVQRKYGTAACPQGCHVMGISMGGFGALRFALLAPEHFSTVTALSAPIFDSEQMLDFRNSFWFGLIVPIRRIWGEPDREQLAEEDLYLRWTRQPDLRGLRLMLAWADHDKSQILEANVKFRAHLNAHGIVHESQVFAGKHDWKSWTPVLERALHVQLAEPAQAASPSVTRSRAASTFGDQQAGDALRRQLHRLLTASRPDVEVYDVGGVVR